MHNAKPHRPGSRYNATQAAAAIDPKHYTFMQFPKESPVQPDDMVQYVDEDGHPVTGKVLVSWSAENEHAVEISIPTLREQHPHLYRMVERRIGRPAGRATRINLRRKALEAASAELTKEQ